MALQMTPNLLKQVKRTVNLKDSSSAGDSRLEVGEFLPAAPVLGSCEMTFDLRQDRILGIEEAVRITGILQAARADTQNAIFNCFSNWWTTQAVM